MPGLSPTAALRYDLPGLLQPAAGESVLGLAVSGGADSLALMHLVAGWARAEARPRRVIVYTVDHGLRPEAAEEVAFVAREAERLGLVARRLRWEGPWPATGVQAAARAARYRLIATAMRADGVSWLLTAHHRNDQAETVLMRLAHGSGLEGLRGMETLVDSNGIRIFRPLLGVDPAVLRAVVAEAGLEPVCDPSNDDLHYERVRWRQVLPTLAALGLDGAEWNRFARRAGEADLALTQWAEERLAALVEFDALGAGRVSLAALVELPRAVAVRMLALLVARTGGAGRQHDLGAMERLHDRLCGVEPVAAMTVASTSIRRRGKFVWFARELGRRPIPAVRVAPAATLVWDNRFFITNRSGKTPIGVRMAHEFSRLTAQRLVGRELTAPAVAIRSAPLVLDGGGQVLALGTFRLSEAVSIELAQNRGGADGVNVTSN